jgi:hypothetical protein
VLAGSLLVRSVLYKGDGRRLWASFGTVGLQTRVTVRYGSGASGDGRARGKGDGQGLKTLVRSNH